MGRGGLGRAAGSPDRPGGAAVGEPPIPSAEEFAGFPSSARATPVPNLFFARLLPRIRRPEELIVFLYFLYSQGLPGRARSRRQPPFLTRRELAADRVLARTLANLCGEDGDPLGRGLDLAVERGSLLRVEARADGRGEELYLLATPHGRRAAQRLAGSDLALGEAPPPAPPDEPVNIFALYEENMGAITPLIADDLKDAEERYPAPWIEAAFREAVSLNKRSWRYVATILRRWEAEGPDYEETGRDPEADWLERRYARGKRGLNARRPDGR